MKDVKHESVTPKNAITTSRPVCFKFARGMRIELIIVCLIVFSNRALKAKTNNKENTYKIVHMVTIANAIFPAIPLK